MSTPLRAWLVVSFALIAAAPALAFDFIVTRYDDPAPDGCLADDCSLREAVIAANAALPLDRILLSAGTYELSIVNLAGEENAAATGDLDFTSNIELLGQGATMTTIDANGIDRVLHFFEVGGGDNPAWTVRGVTITGGGNAGGTALLAQLESVTLEECEITGNGVIGGNETVVASLFGTVTIRRSTIRDNTGVGALAFQATVNLENVTTSGNGGGQLLAGTSLAIPSGIATGAASSTFRSAHSDAGNSSSTRPSPCSLPPCHRMAAGGSRRLGGSHASP